MPNRKSCQVVVHIQWQHYIFCQQIVHKVNNGKNLLLSHNVTNDPRLQSIFHSLPLDFHPKSRELLSLNWAMQPQLHGNLHHQSAEHESGIGPLTCRRKWPGAKET